MNTKIIISFIALVFNKKFILLSGKTHLILTIIKTLYSSNRRQALKLSSYSTFVKKNMKNIAQSTEL